MNEVDREGSEWPRPVFVGGLHRSGTSLISHLLSSHSLVTGLTGTGVVEDEGQFLQSVYLDDGTMGLRNGSVIGQTTRWAYHPEAHLTEDDADRRSGAARSIMDDWRPYWEKPTAPVLLEKSPSNVLRTRFLQRLFPDARFVVITRHPAIQALAVRKWASRYVQVGLNLGSMIEHWLVVMEGFRADADHLAHVGVFAYEELTSNPQRVLERAQKLIDVPVEALATETVFDQSERYRRYWHRMRGDDHGPFTALNPVRRARSIVPRTLEQILVPLVGKRMVRNIEEKYGERIRRFGYDFDDLSSAGPWI